MTTAPFAARDAETYRRARVRHWNGAARTPVKWDRPRTAYHRRLAEVYRHLVPQGQKVLEIGCGQGKLLASLSPTFGVGVDFSDEMLRTANAADPQSHFVLADAPMLPILGQFDVVILSDLVNDLFDVQTVLEQARQVLTQNGTLIVNFYSRAWEGPLKLAQRLRAASPVLPQNWLSFEDMKNLLALADFEILRHWEEMLVPTQTRLVDHVANLYLAHLWPFRMAALTHFVIARPQPRPHQDEEPIVSVIVPARNESGNIAAIFDRTPELGRGTELVFVEGHSRDDTFAEIERQIACHPNRDAQLLKQPGTGKGDAVRCGFAHARGDVLMILDADLTVAPEDLARFYEALRSGKGDFINGVRLVYPMEKQAMRFFNLLGNKFFSLAFSWLLGQTIRDTLCGTKVLRKIDYERIASQRAYFGDFDPFGDFDLLFGAAKLNLKIMDIPIRYHERTYGTTNIQRWRHGLLLLRMVTFAARRLKFV